MSLLIPISATVKQNTVCQINKKCYKLIVHSFQSKLCPTEFVDTYLNHQGLLDMHD